VMMVGRAPKPSRPSRAFLSVDPPHFRTEKRWQQLQRA
ncbi:isoaspartyl peptidase/L-asparaginase, partial [Stenotrophomonas maltophilia]